MSDTTHEGNHANSTRSLKRSDNGGVSPTAKPFASQAASLAASPVAKPAVTRAVSRRTFLGGALASMTSMVSPAFAQSRDWHAVAESAGRYDQCHAIVIYQHGEAVLSNVFRGPAFGRAVPIKSVSKTLVAALAGAAIDRGEIPSVESALGDVAPELVPANADPKVPDITVGNLLTMQAGLERTSGANYGAWVNSPNWVSDALARPIVAEPGTLMLYSTGSSHIMGAVLSSVSGQSLLALARDRLGKPLGIDVPAWTKDPQGRYLGGNEMALTLTGMIRFGEMYRNAGRAGDVQVLSEAWVEQSFVPVTRSLFSGLGYGYGWFLGQSGGVRYAVARGYGGQIIGVVPELELTLAITSDPTRLARSGGYFGDLMRLIEYDIIPTARA